MTHTRAPESLSQAPFSLSSACIWHLYVPIPIPAVPSTAPPPHFSAPLPSVTPGPLCPPFRYAPRNPPLPHSLLPVPRAPAPPPPCPSPTPNPVITSPLPQPCPASRRPGARLLPPSRPPYPVQWPLGSGGTSRGPERPGLPLASDGGGGTEAWGSSGPAAPGTRARGARGREGRRRPWERAPAGNPRAARKVPPPQSPPL